MCCIFLSIVCFHFSCNSTSSKMDPNEYNLLWTSPKGVTDQHTQICAYMERRTGSISTHITQLEWKKKKKKKYECRKINIYFSGSCICVWLLSNLTKSRLSAIILPITHNLFTHTSSCIKHNTSKYWSIVNNPTIVWWMNFWLHVNFILNPHRW